MAHDVDGATVTPAEGQAIVAERYQIPLEIRMARRSISKVRSVTRREERVNKGVAKRSEAPLVPSTALTGDGALTTVRKTMVPSSWPGH